MAIDIAAIDHVLTTTRSVRKRLDFKRPVPDALIQECIDISLQSPTGSNQQGWRVMVVTDAAKRKVLADLYKKGFTARKYFQRRPELDFNEYVCDFNRRPDAEGQLDAPAQ